MSVVVATVCLMAKVFSCEPMEVRIIDGDTFALGAEKIRVQGIDAPEMKGACPAEVEKANLAKNRIAALIGGKTVKIDRNGREDYGRTLATVKVDGTDIGEVLISEGLARRWERKWRPGLDEIWCNG